MWGVLHLKFIGLIPTRAIGNLTSAPTLPVRSSAATMKLSLLALAMLAERSSSLLLFVQQPEEGVNNLKAELGKRSDPESDR